MRIHPLSFTTTLFAVILILSGCNNTTKQPAMEEAALPPATDSSVPAVASAPQAETTTASRLYEGKIVRRPPSSGDKQDGWFLVKDGKRRWISDASWLEKNGYRVADVIEISAEELQSIPEDIEPIVP
jgi:uncharacterized lipoprotein NlpE involved in copper resistance